MTSRASIIPPSRPPLSISPRATVSDKASLTGTHLITLSAGSIIHPFARLDSTHGPIFIDEDVIVWERAVVGSLPDSLSIAALDSSAARAGITIDAAASIHPLAHVSPGVTVGAHADVSVNAVLHPGARLGIHVTVSSFAHVAAGEVVEDYTTVFLLGDQTIRRRGVMAGAADAADAARFKELKEKAHDREVAMLRKVVKGGAKWASGPGGDA